MALRVTAARCAAEGAGVSHDKRSWAWFASSCKGSHLHLCASLACSCLVCLQVCGAWWPASGPSSVSSVWQQGCLQERHLVTLHTHAPLVTPRVLTCCSLLLLLHFSAMMIAVPVLWRTAQRAPSLAMTLQVPTSPQPTSLVRSTSEFGVAVTATNSCTLPPLQPVIGSTSIYAVVRVLGVLACVLAGIFMKARRFRDATQIRSAEDVMAWHQQFAHFKASVDYLGAHFLQYPLACIVGPTVVLTVCLFSYTFVTDSVFTQPVFYEVSVCGQGCELCVHSPPPSLRSSC